MPNIKKFYFQAVDNDNRRISGSIFAESEEIAREKLKKQGLALFGIEEFDEAKSSTKEGLLSFEFEGTNPDKKHVHGKIEAINSYEAYKKLRKEYAFEITSIVDSSLDFEEKSKIIANGISEEFLQLYKEDSFTFKKDENKQKKKVEVVEMSEKDKKELEFYSQEIGIMSREIRALLERSGDYLKREEKRSILKRLGLIERLRQSNAVDHLKNLTNKLIDQISDDKIFMEEKMASEEENQIMDRLRGEFQEYSKSKKKNLASKAMEINLAFNINPRKLALNIYRTRPLVQFGFILYWAVVSIFLLMTVLWVKNGIQLIFFQENITESLYIFKSLLLWLITAISLVNMMVFAPMVFGDKKFSTKIRIIFFGVAFILNIGVALTLPAFL